jgi:phage terminase large subunit-like protein
VGDPEPPTGLVNPAALAPSRNAAVGEIQGRVNRQLRTDGPEPWSRYFLPHLVTGAASPLHDELNAWHRREVDRRPGAMDAFAAPRGHGKSTGGVEIPALWHAAACVRRFTVIVSDTYDQATQRLATVIDEVENNTKLRAAYPDLRPATDAKGQLVRWRDDDVVFACGCRIMAAGAGKSLRGARKGAQRPDLLLLDDLEDEGSVATPAALDKRLRWITRVALGLADPRTGISALWVGTILSRAALLNQATGAALDEGQARPDWARSWTPHIFAAELRGSPKKPTVVVVDEYDEEAGRERKVVVRGGDGKPLTYDVGAPLWSELTRGDLARIRFKLGALSYAAEYLSDPVDDGTTILAPPRLAGYVNPDAVTLARIVKLPGLNGGPARIVPVAAMTRAAALDPQYAVSTATNDPDLAAIVVVGAYGSETFLLDAWIGRDRHGQASRLVDMAVAWECYAAGVEAVAAQAVTADAAAADGRIPIMPITRSAAAGGKVRRALGLSVRLGDRDRPETCRVWVLPDAARTFPAGSLLEQLSRFPHGRYDDAVDATIDAVELAHRVTTAEDTSSATPQSGGNRAT